MRTQMNVPLECVEAEFAERYVPISIEGIEFDEISGVVSLKVDVDSDDAYKLPWIDAGPEIEGIPV